MGLGVDDAVSPTHRNKGAYHRDGVCTVQKIAANSNARLQAAIHPLPSEMIGGTRSVKLLEMELTKH